MVELFLKFINLSITASWLVLVVVILRVVLKKAPKWLKPVLWGIVGLRLILPFSIDSILSLIPSAETVSPDIMYSQEPTIHIGIPVLNSVVNPIISKSFTPSPEASVNPLQIWIPIAAILWIVGIIVMLIYMVISYLLLNYRVKTAVLLRDNIYQSENVTSPFVLGVLHSRIYLPFNLQEKDIVHVIAHEHSHIKRCDHLIKPFSFLLLAFYWFNPVLWVAYILLGRDIELACDERVIKELSASKRADYSEALLSCSVTRRTIAVGPLAFGEVSVKDRVKNVLNYKKPSIWLIVLTVIICIIMTICFLSNPKKASISFDNADGSKSEASDKEGKLSLNDVIKLSQKGEELSWEDFEQFSYVETGSGLYIRVYEINPLFSLMIGGSSTDKKPMYIKLSINTEPEDAIDIRTEDVAAFISKHKADLLEAAISEAVLEHQRNDRSARLICVESHVILDKKVQNSTTIAGSGEQESTVMVYALVYYAGYERYSTQGHGLKNVDGSYIPTELTFTADADGIYTLIEYWVPRDGSYYVPDIKSKFPKRAAKEALNQQVYVDRLSQECEKKALEILKERGSIYDEISRLLYTITSSPLVSSNPGDYISEHQSEYDRVVSYGEDTLRYCFNEFRKENQTDLRGHIMANACQDIMAGWHEIHEIDKTYSTGQDWFNQFRNNAESIQTQYTKEEIEKRYPAIWILLQLQGVDEHF